MVRGTIAHFQNCVWEHRCYKIFGKFNIEMCIFFGRLKIVSYYYSRSAVILMEDYPSMGLPKFCHFYVSLTGGPGDKWGEWV